MDWRMDYNWQSPTMAILTGHMGHLWTSVEASSQQLLILWLTILWWLIIFCTLESWLEWLVWEQELAWFIMVRPKSRNALRCIVLILCSFSQFKLSWLFMWSWRRMSLRFALGMYASQIFAVCLCVLRVRSSFVHALLNWLECRWLCERSSPTRIIIRCGVVDSMPSIAMCEPMAHALPHILFLGSV